MDLVALSYRLTGIAFGRRVTGPPRRRPRHLGPGQASVARTRMAPERGRVGRRTDGSPPRPSCCRYTRPRKIPGGCTANGRRGVDAAFARRDIRDRPESLRKPPPCTMVGGVGQGPGAGQVRAAPHRSAVTVHGACRDGGAPPAPAFRPPLIRRPLSVRPDPAMRAGGRARDHRQFACVIIHPCTPCREGQPASSPSMITALLKYCWVCLRNFGKQTIVTPLGI